MAAPSRDEFPVDFGKYRFTRRIATGGMAEIFLAHDRATPDRPIVVKRILPHLLESSDFVSMFLDEARIAAQLDHENIVRIRDVGQAEGTYFIEMEYVHGEDVRRIYNRAYKLQRSLPLSHSIRVICDAARGLAYAHQLRDLGGRPMGVVHRDVSPQNILVTYDGRVKIVDFGIAKAAGKVTRTRAGVLKGKYSYMSPEQALGEEIDHRTDIFALGIILYETTTGTRLFKRHNELATLQAIIKCEIIPPHEVLHGYPAELEAILLRALAKRRDARFVDANAFADALVDFTRRAKLHVEADTIAEFMRGLFGETTPEDDPVTPTRDLVEAEVKDKPSRSEEEREETASEADTREGSPVRDELPGFAKTGMHPEGSSTRPEADGDTGRAASESAGPRADTIARPVSDLAPTEFAQPVYKDANALPSTVVSRAVAAPTSSERAKPPDRGPYGRSPARGKRRGEGGVRDPDTDRIRKRRDKTDAPPAAPEAPAPEARARVERTEREGTNPRGRPWIVPMRRALIGVAALAVIVGVFAARARNVPRPAGSVKPAIDAEVRPERRAHVTIVTEPGATVYADDRPLGVATPDGRAGPFDVDAGVIRMRVVDDAVGFAREREIELSPGEKHTIELPGREGWLWIAVAPWARVTIDGRDVGLTPIPKLSLLEGDHRVTLENPEIKRRHDTAVRVDAGRTTELRFDLANLGDPM